VSANQKGREPLRIQRYSGMARVNHWVVAISFVILMLSGLAFFHPSLYPLTGLFGGGATARWLHPIAGLVLAVAFLGLFVRFFTANLPEKGDVAWVAKSIDVLKGHEENLPEIGKYNAGQKAVFWSQAILVTVLLVTGIGLWEPGLHAVERWFGFTASLDQRRLAAVIHAGAAILAITIWIVHVYAAIWVRGTLSAMTRGTVSGGWAWRHHRKWLRKEVARDSSTSKT